MSNRQVLRAFQNKTSCAAVPIDFLLHETGEVRSVLNLVDDGALAVFPEKAPRIGSGVVTLIERFERDVFEMIEDVPAQRCFAGLSRSGERQHGIVVRELT